MIESLLVAWDAVISGGDAILEIAEEAWKLPTAKRDGTPVTEADTRAEAVMVELLAQRDPNTPVVAEELWEYATAHIDADGPWWAVDPLDGTKEFVKGLSEYTVNAAVVENGVPVLGAVYLPSADILYLGAAGLGAWRVDHAALVTKKELPPAAAGVALPACSSEGPLVVATSRSHGTDATAGFLRRLADNGVPYRELRRGSSAKFCTVAEGVADCYPRFSRTKVWDCAAGVAVLSAAGGTARALNGNPLTFDPNGLSLPPLICYAPGRTEAEIGDIDALLH